MCIRDRTYTSPLTDERTTTVCCNLCGYDVPSPFLQDDGYIFVCCRTCGLVYQNPQPVFEDLRRRYSQGYFEYEIDNEANFFHLMTLGLRDIGFDALANQMAKRQLAEHAAELRTFLDVGCATGRLVIQYRSEGLDVDGVDLSPEMIEICQRKADKAGVPVALYQQPMEELELRRRYRTLIERLGLRR